MDFFISSAYAQAAQGASPGSPISTFLFMGVIFVAFYFLLIRPQQKKQKQHTQLVAGLKSGDEIITAGGILGTITAISDHYAVVKIGDQTEIKIQKSSVSMVVPKGTVAEA